MKLTKEELSKIRKRLINGETIDFENEDLLESVSLSYSGLGGKMVNENFKIWHNNSFIKITKTFQPVANKLNELIESYDLIEVN